MLLNGYQTRPGNIRARRNLHLKACQKDLSETKAKMARFLGMRLPAPPASASDVAQLAESVGVSLDDIEFLKQYKNEFAEFKVWKTNQKQKPIRPQNESRDPKGRAERVMEQARDSTNVETQKRERSIRPNWINKEEAKATLRELNTNDHGQMVCQICGDEMPFKLEDGSYYFEAVECVKELSRELLQNYIALCPICAAKFRHAKWDSSRRTQATHPSRHRARDPDHSCASKLRDYFYRNPFA